MLETIYVTRHGYRANWITDPSTGATSTSTSVFSPTNIPGDPPLTAHGIDQAHELAKHLATVDPPPTRIYSSPFYRCLQTVEPVAEKLGITEVFAENGIGEWYGQARFEHPSPASPKLLHTFFPRLQTTHSPIVIPSSTGESITEIHDRVAYVLSRIIEAIDKEHHPHPAHTPPSPHTAPTAILLCAHAAPNIAIGRVLTGAANATINTGTCSLSVYTRKSVAHVPGGKATVPPPNADGTVPRVDWTEGRGVGGGWVQTVNGDCGFLKNGEEKNWWFKGDENWDYVVKTTSEAEG